MPKGPFDNRYPFGVSPAATNRSQLQMAHWQAPTLYALPQPLEGLYLDLPEPLPGKAYLKANFLQGSGLVPPQSKASHDEFPLFFSQLLQP